MSQQPIKLVLSDVDGTLVTPDKVLTVEALAAIEKIRGTGCLFSVVSGRPPRGMAHLLAQLNITGTPVAAFNGGILMQPDGTVIEQHLMDAAWIQPIMDVLSAHALDIWIYTPEAWYLRARTVPHADKEVSTVQFDPIVVTDLGQVDKTNMIKITGVSNDMAAVDACQAALRSQLGDSLTVNRSQAYYLDITHQLANKGALVESLSQRLNIAKDAIVTLGDMENDIKMFEQSGISIAMGQATDSVKQKATHVTASNTENGFAQAVQQFILPEISVPV